MVVGVESSKALSLLARYCAGEGIAVIEAPLTDKWGFYDDKRRVIFIKQGLLQKQRAAALMHEVVHYLRGDVGPQPPHVERMVDEQAARMLISEQEYAAAERMVGSEPGALAVELDVALNMVEAYQRFLRRTRL